MRKYISISFVLTVIFSVGALGIVGCGTEPTNEPTAAAIEKANQERFAKIDSDPSMTAAQKDEMKKHMLGGAATTKR